MAKIPTLNLQDCSISIKDREGNEIFSSSALDGAVDLKFREGAEFPYKDQESAALSITGNVKFFCLSYPYGKVFG